MTRGVIAFLLALAALMGPSACGADAESAEVAAKQACQGYVRERIAPSPTEFVGTAVTSQPGGDRYTVSGAANAMHYECEVALDADGQQWSLVRLSGLVPEPSTSLVTPEAPPTQDSYAAVCPSVMLHGGDGADLLVEFSTNPQGLANGGAATTARFDTVIHDLNRDLTVAPESLVMYIEAQRDTLQGVRDYLLARGARVNDFQVFKTAGQEIVARCGAALTRPTR